MAQHFSYHKENSEVVPFNAQYGFPSQGTRASKTTVKVTPREAGPFTAGSVIRIPLPAQGYLDPLRSTLRFKAQIRNRGSLALGAKAHWPRFSKGASCFFNRIRLLYGSLVIEDIDNHNVISRMLSNSTVSEDYNDYSGAIYEGLGTEAQRIRVQSQSLLPDSSTSSNNSLTGTTKSDGVYFQISLMFGLFTQPKLIPLKWMASSLQIELYCAPNYQAIIVGNPPFRYSLATTEQTGSYNNITDVIPATTTVYNTPQLADDTVADNASWPSSCTMQSVSGGFWTTGSDVAGVVAPSYIISDVSYVMDISTFSDAYDQAFMEAMYDKGVPIHFRTWHSFIFGINAQSASYPIQERAKSIVSAFACILSNDLNSENDLAYRFDSFAMTRLSMMSYIWRVGGKYYPAQDVITSGAGVEAYMELQKALNLVGDYETGSTILPQLYGSFNSVDDTNDIGNTVAGFNISTTTLIAGTNYYLAGNSANELSYWGGIDHPLGKHYPICPLPVQGRLTSGWASAFMLGCKFETSNGLEINGLNGEEQNEILLKLTFQSTPGSTYKGITNNGNTLFVFSYFDAVVVIRPNNVVDYIW